MTMRRLHKVAGTIRPVDTGPGFYMRIVLLVDVDTGSYYEARHIYDGQHVLFWEDPENPKLVTDDYAEAKLAAWNDNDDEEL